MYSPGQRPKGIDRRWSGRSVPGAQCPVTFEVAKNAILNIEDDSNFAINKYAGKGEIHVGSGSSLGWGGATNRKYQGDNIHKGYEQIIL